ncbi:PQQ-dependent sugar dehydrogenase [Pontixanthobacter luteolus]|uniref:PQQ-dependent sugar dehydrogenase n=1 Tax=Pontixanthobacter luteolus TaxID=295089 RepID=UPI002304859E|nr:PQQ-dependent sugar dehydrogenase [Pontixanthobacter luteolus]
MTISKNALLALALSPAAIALSSCEANGSVETATETQAVAGAKEAGTFGPFSVTEHGTFNEPWAAAFEPTTGNLFITEKSGQIKFFQPENGKVGTVSGVPAVDYGGQGGLGDIAFAPDYDQSGMIYLSWAEAGDGDTRGAVVGRGKLACGGASACSINDLEIIWRQAPKVTGRGHYSHRIAFSPDGQHLYIASGDRQKMQPAQDTSNTLGTIVRLNLDGTPAAGNPMADKGGKTSEIWSYGHRNILGMDFDAQGRLWETEHGPAGGDEFNLVKAGSNYGWPVVSDGNHYDGEKIPNNSTRPDLAGSAITWTPVIAPGDMVFYKGNLFSDWQGDALIAGLKTNAIIHVKVDGDTAREAARYEFENRLRTIDTGSDGALWVLEDGEGGRLLRLTPQN